MNISERIKYLRELLDISSTELAEITGIHPVSIRKYETNKMVPGIDIIDKMCNALQLPRMIFEDTPPQYINYDYSGDFYQQLLVLLNNEILAADPPSMKSGTFTINPSLAKYIQIKRNDEVIPLDELTININPTDVPTRVAYAYFKFYMDSLAFSQDRIPENYNILLPEDLYKTKKDALDRNLLRLMLFDYSLEKCVESKYTRAELKEMFNQCAIAGGDYYSFIEGLDVPLIIKKKCIEAYEDKYILTRLMDDGFLDDDDFDIQIANYLDKKSAITVYKNAHPTYKEDIKKYAAEEAASIRMKNNN